MDATTVQKQIINYVEQELNGYCVNLMKSSRRGDSDLLICIDGRFIGVEVKVGSDTVKPLQVYKLERIQKAGGVAFIATSLKDFKEKIKGV